VPNSQAIFATVPVALLYQGDNLGSHLKEALRDLGADIVYESLAINIDREALAGCGARIVVFNLDSDSDAQIDHVYDVLDEGDYEVVFNDANASAQLAGSDQARWARHLAAKILNKPEIAVPARPVWAESVPTRTKKSAAVAAAATVTPIARQAAAVAPEPELVIPAAMASEESASIDAALPVLASETPTLELPVLDTFSVVELEQQAGAHPAEHHEGQRQADVGQATAEHAIAEQAGAEGDAEQDFSAALEDFARQVPTHTYAAPAEDDFASQIDALFSDTRASGPAARKPQEVTESGTFAGVESLFGESTPPTAATAGADADFPVAFDNMDVAAAAIPEAVDRSFKPGRLPGAADNEPATAEQPLLPPDWSLEPLSDETTPAGPATGRASFGIDKISASDFLAPESDGDEASVTQLPVDDALSLELMPMEEAVAPAAFAADAAARPMDPPASRLKVGASAELRYVFVLGASIGGPEAVREFLGALPRGFPALFVLVQHMGGEFLELMSAQLARSVSLTVRTPTHGEIFGHGEIVIVTTKQRLQIDAVGVVTLSPLPERTAYSPSIDLVLRDVADQFGDKAGAIIFSGMAQDAIAGSAYLKARGGVVWTQDPNTCTISTMVDAVTQTGAVTFSGSPQELAAKMIADYGAG